MSKARLKTGYTFTPSIRRIDFGGVASFDIAGLLLIENVAAQQTIYAVDDPAAGYSALTGSVVTLTTDTTGMSAADPLLIYYDDGLGATDLATDTELRNVTAGIGTPADTAPATDSASGSLIAKLTRLLVTQTSAGTLLAAVRDRLPATLVGGRLTVDGSGVTQPVSAAALPLPSGAASATNQASEIAALGAPADAAYAGTGNSSIVAALKGLYAALTAAIPAGTNTIGGTVAKPATAGGLSQVAFRTTTAASQNPVAVRAGAGHLYGYHFYNAATTTRYVHFYNTGTLTFGTTTDVRVVAIPPGGSVSYSAGGIGIAFSAAISVAITTGPAANDNTTTGIAIGDVTGTIDFF